jgi:hypothetical protein
MTRQYNNATRDNVARGSCPSTHPRACMCMPRVVWAPSAEWPRPCCCVHTQASTYACHEPATAGLRPTCIVPACVNSINICKHACLVPRVDNTHYFFTLKTVTRYSTSLEQSGQVNAHEITHKLRWHTPSEISCACAPQHKSSHTQQ